MIRILILSVCIFSQQLFAQSIDTKKIIADAEKQTRVMLEDMAAARSQFDRTDVFSPRTVENGTIKLVSSRDWTSGFFPGKLWLLYEFTGKEEWKKKAEEFTSGMEKEKANRSTHDLGFMMYCSYGMGYSITKDPAYKDVLVESARSLAKRFNPVAGLIKSWESRKDWPYPVIIDNMMNLELLFEATKLSGDSSFYKIAVRHAITTMKNHFRSDYSSYHVLIYDTLTGKAILKTTAQGYSAESAWARGQAWGLYGFTMCYRETKNKLFLYQAQHIASFILDHLPGDGIPYWDFNAPNIPNEPRDASAAAVMASALYELSSYSSNGKIYRNAANKIMESLTGSYRSAIGENQGFILLHSTGAKPLESEIDVPITYADYYYLEALSRMMKLRKGKKIF